MWVLMLALASCQDVAEEPAPGDNLAVAPGYPSLHTVPPRPQLSYTVEQRRAIVDGLIADRANARYSSGVVRYRAGLSSLPPPAAPALAAVPLAPEPETPDAAAATARRGPARDAPVVNPETEFLYEDDNLDSFMEEMVNDPIGPPGSGSVGPGGEPGAYAAPLGTRVIRASALRPISPAAAYPGRAPVVTLAMPPATASLPVPAPVEAALAGRAPGVVWGMPNMSPPPAEPISTPARGAQLAASSSAPVETTLAGRAPGVVWGMPDMAPAPAEPRPAAPESPAEGMGPASSPAPAPIETALAGRAPGVIWGMPDMTAAPPGPTPAATSSEIPDIITAARAAPFPAPAKPRTAPGETVLAAAAAEPVRADEPRHARPAAAPVRPAQAPVDTVLAGPAPELVRAIPAAAVSGHIAPTVAADARPADAVTTAHVPLPAPAKPVASTNETTGATALAGGPIPQPVPKPVAAGIEIAGGRVIIDAGLGHERAAAFGSVPFDPQSAMLTPDALARLAQFLAETEPPAARIKIVGEATAPALALDRALAVGLALVQSGVSADRLEITLARSGSDDQARLFLAAPAL
jgi:outer membrane protein OmpA-like peptidoglycan-associated protein